MKIRNIKLKCSVIVLVLTNFVLFSQNFSLNEIFKWKYEVNPDVEVVYNNYDCNTMVLTSEGNTVQYELTVYAKAKKQDELDILKNYIQNIDYSGSPSRVELYTSFFKQRNNKNSKSEITLKNDEKITVYSLRYTAILKIPTTAYLNLQSKYSEIEIGNIHRLTIESHDDNIYGENVGSESDLVINAKYSKIKFNETGNTVINTHDCTIDFTGTDNLKIVSKYSEFNVIKSKNASIDSHNDKFDFNITGNIRLSAKYTDFKSNVSGNTELNLHDCNVNIADAQMISINSSKYSDCIFENVQGIKITSSHDDNYIIENLSTLEITETKYSDYKIGTLNQKLFIQSTHNDNYIIDYLNMLDIIATKYSDYKIGKLIKNFSIQYGHDDNVNISEVTSDFDKYYQNGKYAKIKLNLSPKIDFILNCSGKYLKIDSNVKDLKINIDKTQSSYSEFEGIRGVKKENMPLIKIEGDNMDVKIY